MILAAGLLMGLLTIPFALFAFATSEQIQAKEWQELHELNGWTVESSEKYLR